MSTTLPVTFTGAPLPVGFVGTPEQLYQAIKARLRIESDESLAIISIAATAPTSNVGPWLKDGTTWYVWDTVSGAYVPLVLEFQSLRYIASATAPDQTKYTFWIELNGSGKAIAVKYYSGGAWKDIYEDKFLTYSTTAQMNTAIAAAVGGFNTSINQYPFRARKNAAAQAYTAGTGDAVIVFDAEDFDTGSSFAANTFTAPVNGFYFFKASMYASLASGAPTGIDRQIKLRVNGVVVTRKNAQINDLTGGQTQEISDTYELVAGDTVDVVINYTSTGASGWSILNDSTETFFEGHRIIKP